MASQTGNMIGITTSLEQSLDKPFMESAVVRVKPHYQLLPGATLAPSAVSFSGPTRAFSGEPSYKSDEAVEAIEDSGGVVNAPGAERYLQKILNRLLSRWPYATPRMGVFISSKGDYGAVSTFDGDILIYAGTLLELKSEDELAAILAHEASHVLLRHSERTAALNQNKKFLNAAMSMAIQVAYVRNSKTTRVSAGRYRSTLNDPEGFKSMSARAAGVCLATRYFVDKIFDASWGVKQEDEADLLAIDLMQRAGYSLNGNIETLKLQVKRDGDLKNRLKTQIRAQRGDYDAVVKKEVKKSPGLTSYAVGYFKAIGQGLVNTFQDLDTIISQRHRVSKQRLVNVQSYISRFYADRQRQTPDRESYSANITNRSTKVFLKNHVMAYDAYRAYQNDRMDDAMKLAKRAIRPPTNGEPATRFVMYLLLKSDSRTASLAFKQLLAIRRPERAPITVLWALAMEYKQRRQYEKAIYYGQLAWDKVGKRNGEQRIAAILGFTNEGPCKAVNNGSRSLIKVLGGDERKRNLNSSPSAATIEAMKRDAERQRQEQRARAANRHLSQPASITRSPQPPSPAAAISKLNPVAAFKKILPW